MFFHSPWNGMRVANRSVFVIGSDAWVECTCLIGRNETGSGTTEVALCHSSYTSYPGFSTRMRTEVPSSTPWAKVMMNLPSLSVVVGDFERFPITVTIAPATGRRDCPSTTIPDIVKVLAWAAPTQGTTNTSVRNRCLAKCLIVYEAAERGFLLEARRLCQGCETHPCSRAAERDLELLT